MRANDVYNASSRWRVGRNVFANGKVAVPLDGVDYGAGVLGLSNESEGAVLRIHAAAFCVKQLIFSFENVAFM